jgi:hypothetical protein
MRRKTISSIVTEGNDIPIQIDQLSISQKTEKLTRRQVFFRLGIQSATLILASTGIAYADEEEDFYAYSGSALKVFAKIISSITNASGVDSFSYKLTGKKIGSYVTVRTAVRLKIRYYTSVSGTDGECDMNGTLISSGGTVLSPFMIFPTQSNPMGGQVTEMDMATIQPSIAVGVSLYTNGPGSAVKRCVRTYTIVEARGISGAESENIPLPDQVITTTY